jgi:hypothetical protein
LRKRSLKDVAASVRQRLHNYAKAAGRMKDFYDIWLLSRQFEFHGQTLARAVTRTFANRKTEILGGFRVS